MRDIIGEIREWIILNKPFVLATVVRTWRSAPRPVGSAMAVSEDGKMIGSVSGGCIEKNVIKASQLVLETQASRWLSFGVSDDDAWEVGLSCGGKIDVLVEPFLAFGNDKEIWEQLDQSLDGNHDTVLITTLDSNTAKHGIYLASSDQLFGFDLPDLKNMAHSALASQESSMQVWQDSTYFLQVFPRKPRMILIGSAHITTELLILAQMHDFETIVIDPRNTFARKTMAVKKPGQLWVQWPQEVLPQLEPDSNTYAVILSHDPKIDDPALEILLGSDVPYIGALGSTKTHQKRLVRLEEKGFSTNQLRRIHAPVGLDIKARLAREIALSIMAEIIAVKNNKHLAKSRA